MLWIKALHIVFVASWFAGLFYLPRLFINLVMVPADSHAERERLLLMARKLKRFTGLLMVPVVAVALIVLQQSGFFDQFVNRLVDDDGSAGTRVEMFELFKYLNWYDFLLGPDPRQIATLMAQHGLLYGIESFWVAVMLLHGLVVSLLFFAALFFFCREAVTSAGTGAFVVFLYFFAVASTSVSLSAKSPVFAIMVMLAFVLGNRSTAAAR